MAAKKKAPMKAGASTAPQRRKGNSPSASAGNLDSRTKLIDAALRVILDRGIDAVRVEDIVSEVGVTKGSLYWHFEDRQGLIKAAIAEQIRRMSSETIAGMSDAISTAVSKEDYLARISPFLVDPFDNDKVRERWGRLGILVEAQNDPDLRKMISDVQARHLEVAVELMTAAQTQGLLRGDLDPRSVAVMLSVINLGSNVIDVLGDKGPDPEAWWHLIAFFVDAMFPPATPGS